VVVWEAVFIEIDLIINRPMTLRFNGQLRRW
jgi:hypothetical protein